MIEPAAWPDLVLGGEWAKRILIGTAYPTA